jgi:hypothetical protein
MLDNYLLTVVAEFIPCRCLIIQSLLNIDNQCRVQISKST